MKSSPFEPANIDTGWLQTLRYPDFICIGAQKSATTWLYEQLRTHPDVWVPPHKEFQYFISHHPPQQNNKAGSKTIDSLAVQKRHKAIINQIRKTLNREKKPTLSRLRETYCLSLIALRDETDEWYGRIFQAAPRGSVCGELSTTYALLPDAGVAHMVGLNPQVKIIFLMRDPIERSWSALRMQQRKGKTGAIESIIRQPIFMGFSDYVATIERYRRFVSPENMLLAYYEDVIDRPRELMEQICGFLGVSFEQGRFSKLGEVVHKGQHQELDPDLYAQLKDVLAPTYERLLTLKNPIVEGWYRRHFGAALEGGGRYSESAQIAGHRQTQIPTG